MRVGNEPRDAVDEMIGIARVRCTDLVYDLGCGDGRVVIAAAAKTDVNLRLRPKAIGIGGSLSVAFLWLGRALLHDA